MTGCHVLALDLVRNWSFENVIAPESSIKVNGRPPEMVFKKTYNRPNSLHIHRRRPSILIDMDIPSESSSRAESPTRRNFISPIPEDSIPSPPLSPTSDQRQFNGFGSLLRSAKRVSRVAEFDLSSFGDFSSPTQPAPASEEKIIQGKATKSSPQEVEVSKSSKLAGVGSLMAPKSAVNVPEFDMDNFF